MVNSVFRLKVRSYELDSIGHVNNAVYLHYAEEAKWHFFSETNILDILNEKNLFPIVLENNVRYMHELRNHEDVRIDTTWSTKGKIINFTHVIYNETRKIRSCVVKCKVAFVDETRLMYDIPDELLKLENQN